MAYLLDTDVFIQAKNLHYGFDFCPAFWAWLETSNRANVVFSIEQVRDEILSGDDVLAQWVQQQGAGFFLTADAGVLPSLRAVSTWVSQAGYEPAAVSIFLQAADYHLVARAHAGGHVVVTHEVPSPSTKRIKIPDACIGVGVKCMTPFQMLRAERARFVLESR